PLGHRTDSLIVTNTTCISRARKGTPPGSVEHTLLIEWLQVNRLHVALRHRNALSVQRLHEAIARKTNLATIVANGINIVTVTHARADHGWRKSGQMAQALSQIIGSFDPRFQQTVELLQLFTADSCLDLRHAVVET